MKRIHHELTYPGATVEDVAAMLATPEFRESVADYQGVLRRTVTVEEGDRTTVSVEMVHGTEGVPGFARKLVGEEISIVQTERWSSDHTGDVRVEIPGKPGEMEGTARLAQQGPDAVETIDLTLQVRIPLVGGKVEDLIAGLLERAFRAENKVGRSYLAGS